MSAQMTKIYKINVLDEEGRIKHIAVCNGTTPIEAQTHFSPEENQYIETNNVPVVFAPIRIYDDDTIDIIKRKILGYSAMPEDDDYYYKSLYMFGIIERQFDVYEIYKTLTENDRIELAAERLIQFLSNFIDLDISALKPKETYVYEDLVAIEGLSRPVKFKVPIGQKLAIKNNYIFPANPFDVVSIDAFAKYSEDSITTLNNNLLFETWPSTGLVGNNIFVCDPGTVFAHASASNLRVETFASLYFPFLATMSIRTLEAYRANKDKLARDVVITDLHKRSIETIDTFYNMNTDAIRETDNGINLIEFNIYSATPVVIPLEVIFKLLSATPEMPFIKYNPSARLEKLYRLYTNKVAKNGRRIPVLARSLISTLRKEMATTKSVACFMEYKDNGTHMTYRLTFYEDGHINCVVTADNQMSREQMEVGIKERVNPVVNVLKEFLSQSGYNYSFFNSLDDANVEIVNIRMVSYIGYTKKVAFKPYISLLSIFCNVNSDNIDEGTRLRYKRVSNFNDMTSQHELILRIIKDKRFGNKMETIIKELRANFNMTEEEAALKYAEFIATLKLEADGKMGHKMLRVRNNPGFDIYITRDNIDMAHKRLKVVVNYVDALQYVDYIPVFYKGIIALTQGLVEAADKEKLMNIVPNKAKDAKQKAEAAAAAIEDVVGKGEDVFAPEPTEAIDANEFAEDDDLMENDLMMMMIGNDDDYVDDEEMLDEAVEEAKKEEKEPAKKPEANINKPVEAEEDEEDGFNIDQPDEETMIGMEINGVPNYFYKRMLKRDPKLFKIPVKDKNGNPTNFSSYSRMCSHSVRRQPVILTDEEKAKIDREHPDSYDKDMAIKYGSDPNKQFWYICPRYWCMTEGVSLSEKEVKEGKCSGNVISRDEKRLPENAHIYEFAIKGNKEHFKGDEYIPHNPGFLKDVKHPNNLCLPCCFKNWDKPDQKQRRDKCMRGDIEPAEKQKVKVSVEANANRKQMDDYIKGIDKFPLDVGRWGYINIAVQKMLFVDAARSYYANNPNKIVPNRRVYLRKGVEINDTRSFVACLADLFADFNPQKTVYTIKDMLEYLINHVLSIDAFVKYHNGNLLNDFDRNENAVSVNMEKFKTSDLYRRLKIDAILDKLRAKTETSREEAYTLNYFKRVCAAYNNFVDYLRDGETILDYTYLWDIISEPHPRLFPNGMNIIIMRDNNNDMTNNIDVICPSTINSANIYNSMRPTWMVYTNGVYYEPIYGYTISNEKGETVTVDKTFTETAGLPRNLVETFKYIKYSLTKCSPIPATLKMAHIHNQIKGRTNEIKTMQFRENFPAVDLRERGATMGHRVSKQVSNYNGRIIGLIFDDVMYVPCRPSGEMPDIEVVYYDDVTFRGYSETVGYLEKLSAKMPSKPVMRIIDDGMIVGILTETNQFVPLGAPEENVFDDSLISQYGDNYMLADTIIQNAHIGNEKTERELYIKKIALETNFFNTFRNILRIRVNDAANRQMKTRIEAILNSAVMKHREKLDALVPILRKIMSEHVMFSEYSDEVLMKMTGMGICEKTSTERKSYCFYDGDTSKFIIPNKHLLTGRDNEEIYFGRVADELVRYGRIKVFMFKPDMYISFNNVGYKMTDNEIIIQDALLFGGYMDDLSVGVVNPYIRYNNYDAVNSANAAAYKNLVKIEEAQIAIAPPKEEKVVEMHEKEMKMERVVNGKKFVLKRKVMEPAKAVIGVANNLKDKCVTETVTEFKGSWQPFFEKGTKQYVYATSPECSFAIIQMIISDKTKANVSLSELKINLYRNYARYLPRLSKQILRMLNVVQGKKTLTAPVIKGEMTFEQMIMSDAYYMTNLDIFMLAEHYQLPIFLLGASKIKENGQKLMSALEHKPKANVDDQTAKMNDYYYFVKQQKSVIGANVVPDYYLFVNSNDEIRYPYSRISEDLRNAMVALVLGIGQPSVENIILETADAEVPNVVIKAKKPTIKKVKLATEVPDVGGAVTSSIQSVMGDYKSGGGVLWNGI